MTREEAIRRLKNMAWLYGSAEREPHIEAIDMAIEALTLANLKSKFESADAVSREEYEEIKAYMDTLVDAFIEDGKELAESVKVVRCKDCKWYKKIVEKSKSGLCHYDLVARCLHDEDYCSHGERRNP